MALTDTIQALCQRQLGRAVDLEDPRGYNDKIQWLKIYDQRQEQVTACDKIAVRSMVADAVGSGVLIERQPWPPVEFPCVVKATHDSGSAEMLRSPIEARLIEPRMKSRLKHVYGADKGEWAYAMVPPRLIVETALPGEVIDYKFHCVHGQVRWVQAIWDRATGRPHEAIFAPDGTVTRLHMDEKMQHDPGAAPHPGAEAWAALLGVAERLAELWRYVRVDLYWTGDGVKFGELTFWPRAGCYRSKDELVFGDMLDIDMSERFPAIVA